MWGTYDTFAFRLELNFLTVSFIQDVGTYCYVLRLILFIPYARPSDTCGAEKTVFDDMLSCMT